MSRKAENWNNRLNQWLKDSRRTVLRGAGLKDVTFLHIVKAGGRIEYPVDINLRKQGMYVAGTGQRIVPPDFPRGYLADMVLVVDPMYQQEKRVLLGRMGAEPGVVTV